MTTNIQRMPMRTEDGVKNNRWLVTGSVGAIAGLFLLAVSIAGWTVNTAYESSQWQKREQAALTAQKELREELSQTRSLATALEYAQSQGFVAGTALLPLDTTQPVAQNITVR